MTRFWNTPPIEENKRLRLWSDILYWVLLIGGCAVFLLMNFFTTLKEDDIFHSSVGGWSVEPINSLLDVFRSWAEYYRFDSRSSNLVDFLFNGILGKTAFNVCNTLVFGVMAHMLSRLATGRNSAMVLVMLYTYMVTAMPVPGETMLWAAGSCNYMWAIASALLFIAYLLWHRDPHPAWYKAVIVLLLSFWAGAVNESTTFGVFGGLVLYYLLNRDKVDRAVLIAMTGYLLGVILLLTCPGAWERASSEVNYDAGFLSMMAERFRIALERSKQYITPVAAVVVLVLFLIVRGFKKTFKDSPYALIFLVLMAFVFVVGKDQQRLYFGLTMFSFLLVAMAVYWALQRFPLLRLAVMIAGLVLCVKCYPANIRTMKQYQQFYDQVENDIRQAPDRQVVLKTRNFKGYSRFIKYVVFDSWNFPIREQSWCFYYDKDNIQFVPDSVYHRYHEGRLLDGAVALPYYSPDCKEVEAVLAVPMQDYFAVKMRQDTVSCSYQMAFVSREDGTPMPLPIPYFPLLYQGHEYLIFPTIADDVYRISFSPFAPEGDHITLERHSDVQPVIE